MWLLVMNEDMEIITKRQVLCGDWSHWEINLNDEDKKFTPIIPEGLTSVVKISTEVYQKIFHPTIEDTISGYKKQIKHKQEEIALIHERIEKLKSTKQY